MFMERYQGKLLSIFYSLGSKPLADWAIQCQEGSVCPVWDDSLKSSVLEILSKNVITCFISIPADPKCSLGIKLPFLTLLIKNMDKYFTFEITVLDSEKTHRRFRVSNYTKRNRLSSLMFSMPMCLDVGWNQVTFNIAQFTQRTFHTEYLETVRVQVHANCRLRRVYFSRELFTDEELPNDFRMCPIKLVRPKPKIVLPQKKAARNKTADAKVEASAAARVEAPAPAAAAITEDTTVAEAEIAEGTTAEDAVQAEDTAAEAIVAEFTAAEANVTEFTATATEDTADTDADE